MSRVHVLSAWLLTGSTLLIPPLSAIAQSGTVDGNDFLMWQRSVSFAQDEVVELSIEYVDPPGAAEDRGECRLQVSEKSGAVLGSVAITLTGLQLNPTRVESSRGFGFIEKVINVESGVLQVNGEAVAPLAPNPWTGRNPLGLSILCTLPFGREAHQMSGIRWLVLGPDSSTRTADGVDLNRNFQGHWGYDFP